ncbi:uncharacterized protein N7503_000589 [Penicillium pulvis]|uniref:uncharacterized protein n=1 Tax=Penicillium pulvis TaxID=1562058 RepID=UPI002547E14E|nr:uncharacterized protein N7503_000589 [Penicillium pulvis]KAJ5813839.1 hypothetical protein N7503_000589 [Penicillium pulvis]
MPLHAPILQEEVFAEIRMPSWRKKLSNIPKFSQKPSPSDLEGILTKIERSTAEFERVVNLVRDQTIEATGLMTHAMTSQMSVVQDDMHQARDILERSIEKDDRRHEDTVTLCKFIFSAFHQIAEREIALQRSQLQARNGLMEVLQQGQMHRLEMKKIQQKLGKVARPSSMITEDELLQILLNSSSDPAELSLSLQQPNKDLDRVLSNKGRHSEDIQVEIQTCLLHHRRILQWIESINSDLVLVDAHLYNASMPKISAASVFSASFITTLLSTSSDAVVVHYFCGVHLTPNDKWLGPKGLIRFITIQLLLRLMATHKIDLDFIDSREFVQDLEDHDLSRLCDLLYTIIEQFSEEVTIWCVIDSIQRFDKPSTLADLRSVMDFLHCLVNDTTLGPVVKIFMTNPNHSKRSITQLPTFQSDPTRLISLRPSSAKAARRLSDRVIGDQLSRALDYRLSENDAEY